ncbi:hypothetical protein MTR_1g022280 [Medicago truncatula]|uniref:Uncharacterized protein n=1 Tax=Medicago truncatula TaxID=3880 RepID=A0A072VPT3_MEDTR|nr:hypothetical protein MTR_1g022280 [Medicago truncatula]
MSVGHECFVLDEEQNSKPTHMIVERTRECITTRTIEVVDSMGVSWQSFLRTVNFIFPNGAPETSVRADNEPNQLEQNSRLDSTIDLLNLVHEPNELNLSSKLSLLT